MMKYPDTVAMKGHDYEELPSSRYVPTGSFKYDYADERGTHLISPSLGNVNMASQPSMNTLTGSDVPHYPARRRENPLYEAYDERDELVKDGVDRRGPSRCCHLVITAVCFLCLAVCVLIVLMLTGMLAPVREEMAEHPSTAFLRSSHNSTEHKLQQSLLRIEELEKHNKKLSEQFEQLQSLFNIQMASLQQNLSSQGLTISQQGAALSHLSTALHADITAVNGSLSAQINNVAKMEGPMGPRGYNGSQGPSGAGNMSMCRSIHITKGSDGDPIMGTWAPTTTHLKNSDPSNWVVLGAECSSKGRSEHQLETRVENGVTQYRCLCSNGQQPSFCDITMWLCPLIS